MLEKRGIPVVGDADRLTILRQRCAETHPQVVVSAERFPDGDLLAGLTALLSSGARILAVCESHSDNVVDILLAGASGCVFLTDGLPDDVAQGVRTVSKGGSALHPLAAHAVLNRWRAERDGPSPSNPRRDVLTSREREILAAMARGLTTRGVAEKLEISVKTVEAHKARVFAKLGARNQAHAVSLARSRHLLD
ncbi:response regulator transcription factor [Blastococcus saxobsidens]|uniref:response regulator transcription factor n=1 Tax=Blastococcus saxobsidens TaxID=138336 RepID=UPI00140F97D3|nr:response regulator transcription factor [Blastococcus saxobsidens]